ncbi:hypothetical protein RDI58_002954 [Solanum bulbocastanum]|uniref:Germin-like protein n=1 Tax=Solanum bulbocastanum TaxID=147425 RepID=A0AAN8YRN3_SOLBU
MALLAINSDKACAGDPDMLQDICVADLTSTLKVNGFPCKNTSTAADFSSVALSKPGVITSTYGSVYVVTGANVPTIPGLNTLGVFMARVDYAPGGINPPHVHPRPTEMIFVLHGTLDVGFITTKAQTMSLFSKRIVQGQVFVFPRGVVHFQKNNGKYPAAVIAALNSQLPAAQSIATKLFAATPPLPNDVLPQTFRITSPEAQLIKAKFATN